MIPGDLRVFLCTATGWGTVRIKDGEVSIDVAYGRIDVDRIAFTPYGGRASPHHCAIVGWRRSLNNLELAHLVRVPTAPRRRILVRLGRAKRRVFGPER